MKYCIECGSKLITKYLEGEGDIPYCNNCRTYRFPIFNTAVSMIVLNSKKDKILLIKQYGGKDYILVAGYVNKGENAENAVVREVKEEIGMDVLELNYNKSMYYEKSNTLMINFTCVALDESLENITKEVDEAKWFSFEDAKNNIKKDSLAEHFLLNYILGSRYDEY